ncbi:MAG: M20/M25/M40 family metallo-hydrolase [Bacteroidota bacterium]
MRYLCSLLSIFFLTNITAQSSAEFAQQQLQADVVYLASNLLEGRETGKAGAIASAKYIAARFEEIGLSTKGDNKSYFQTFDFNYSANPNAAVKDAKTGRNVVGYINNKAKTTVIIGAHFDHLGKGGGFLGTARFASGEIHNGADDNASGVGALLYLAKKLKSDQYKKHNYLFIAFSAEEMGMIGSKYFTNHPTIDLSKVSYMLNMDMIGRLDEEKSLIINGAGTSPSWKAIFPKIKMGDFKITTNDSGIGQSDHTSFYLKDLPVLHFFTGNHTDYHKPTDDSEKINFEGIQLIADWIMALIERLPKKGKLAFTKTKEESKQKVASFKVTLGVMPDYVFQGGGMRIESVLDDRPAKNGGLEDGDVVIQMNDIVIKDIYGYMDALSTFKRGQAVKVIVKRGEEEVEKEVVF